MSHPQSKEMHSPKSVHILVVEDNQHNRELLKFQLTFLGFECHVAADGKEAIEFLKNQAFDMVITDCHMPQIDGFQLSVMIREGIGEGIDGVNKEMPIIALTGDLSDDGLLRCKSVGMNAIIGKPVAIDDLKHHIGKFLSFL